MMITKKILSWLGIAIISWSLIGCGNDTIDSIQAFDDKSKPPIPGVEKIVEVSPPPLITKLNQIFAQTKPQVKIISPNPDEIVNTQNVEVKLQVEGLDIFKNEKLKMGPHLHFFVDDKPYQAIYNTDKPIVLSDLTPGTHTLRVFASRPWHESFKNRGAYAQATFHVFTVTEENNPSSEQPLLTYSRPQGVYGAQPIMLDFYLTNAPLHVVAQEKPDDDIADWRIRVTINGESFLLDQWQPIYLEGFNQGKNWVKLEFIDENGDLIKNVFNSTVRAITYDPQLDDTLTKLVKGKISLEEAKAITIPDYQIKTNTLTPEITKQKTESVTEIEIETQPLIKEEEEQTKLQEEVAPEIIIEDNVPEKITSDVEETKVEEENTSTEIIEEQTEESPITQVEEKLKIDSSSANNKN